MTQEQANAVIYEMSKNSAFFKNARARDAKLNLRIEKLRRRLPTSRPVSSPFMDRLVDRLEAQRRLDRVWCVVDMDMFYAAVAMRDNPSLRGKPIAVGGIGMISTANSKPESTESRSAMPGFIAKRLCPQLILVKSDWAAYRLAAQQTRDIFREYDPNFTAGSLDEASLDITDYLKKRYRRESQASSKRSSLLIETQAPSDDSSSERRRKALTKGPRICFLLPTPLWPKSERCRLATNGLTCSAGIGPNTHASKNC